jgi:hypothetical protein
VVTFVVGGCWSTELCGRIVFADFRATPCYSILAYCVFIARGVVFEMFSVQWFLRAHSWIAVKVKRNKKETMFSASWVLRVWCKAVLVAGDMWFHMLAACW